MGSAVLKILREDRSSLESLADVQLTEDEGRVPAGSLKGGPLGFLAKSFGSYKNLYPAARSD